MVGLSGLQARYDEQLRGTPGRPGQRHRPARRTATLFGSSADRRASRCGSPSTRPAGEGRAGARRTGPASALVAIRPSTGDILAAANGPGNGGLNAATFGQYAPGSTFKVVSSLALLRSGLRPDTG